LPCTYDAIRVAAKNVFIVAYNNDDPYSPLQPKYLWRHYLASVPRHDLIFAYRECNVDEYMSGGARRVRLLRDWFVPSENFPIMLSHEDQRRFACDVAFIGHYEADSRGFLLEHIRSAGYKLKVYGSNYPRSLSRRLGADGIGITPVLGIDYNKALCGAEIALCLLSNINRDTYTRRVFEIPATRTFMLSVFTADIAAMFARGAEADYFSDSNELLSKIAHYINNRTERRRIADAGLRRVWADGHDVVSRMRHMVSMMQEARGTDVAEGLNEQPRS